MATVRAKSHVGCKPVTGEGDYVVWTWAALAANGDTGDPLSIPDFADMSVQMTGTFGAAVVFEGSNDGVNYETLNNHQGTAISLSAAGLKGVAEKTLWVRPRATGAVTSVVVTLFARRDSK